MGPPTFFSGAKSLMMSAFWEVMAFMADRTACMGSRGQDGGEGSRVGGVKPARDSV